MYILKKDLPFAKKGAEVIIKDLARIEDHPRWMWMIESQYHNHKRSASQNVIIGFEKDDMSEWIEEVEESTQKGVLIKQKIEEVFASFYFHRIKPKFCIPSCETNEFKKDLFDEIQKILRS